MKTYILYSIQAAKDREKKENSCAKIWRKL